MKLIYFQLWTFWTKQKGFSLSLVKLTQRVYWRIWHHKGYQVKFQSGLKVFTIGKKKSSRLKWKTIQAVYNLLPRDYVLLPSIDYERAKKIHVGITLNNHHWHSRKVPSLQSFLTFTHSLLFPSYFHKPGPIGKPGLNGARWPHVVTSITVH